MSSTTPPPARAFHDLSVSDLARTIFRAELPEQYVRTFPAQSLYLALKHNGLHSSAELIEIAALEQCRLFLDFDLWEQDRFNEENFWEWLALADEENGLKLLQKFLRFVDLKIIALIIERHVDVRTFEEKTDNPPGPGYYTPDGGSTWVRITLADGTRHFLLARFLALIFESSPELFYQLLAIPGVQTASMLEEEAYSERSKRLLGEGIPDRETAHAMLAPLSADEARRLLEKRAVHEGVSDIRAIEPLVYTSTEVEPLRTLLAEVLSSEEFQSELTFVTNAALVYFDTPAYDEQEVFKLLAKLKGAVNIGLETAQTLSTLSPIEIYRALGVTKLCRLGLSRVLQLRRAAAKAPAPSLAEPRDDAAPLLLAREAAIRPFPEIPSALRPDGSFAVAQGAIAPGCRAIETMSDVRAVLKALGLPAE